MKSVLNGLEHQLYAWFPAAYADGLSSFFHLYVCLQPGLLIARGGGLLIPTLWIVFAVLGSALSGYLAYLYWLREDSDTVKHKRIVVPLVMRRKINDSLRDRWAAVAGFVLTVMMSFG